ncbi:MAG: hypothetical protein KR126chlam1_00270 [Chlamydiae bacterium]|nr:hypothetical protein [Chlamydiota bacterium]
MMKKICSFILLFAGSTLFGSSMVNDIDKATIMLREFKSIPEQSIPPEIIDRSEGLAFINVIKAGFIFSGRIGSGIVVARTNNGWSAPSAIGIAGAGWGLQIGGQITDLILVLNSRDAVSAFASGGSITLGGNVSVAAGPVGRSFEAGIGLPPALIYSYSRTKGLFAGVSLEGTVIVEKSGENANFYGSPVSAREILSGSVARPQVADSLYKELNTY